MPFYIDTPALVKLVVVEPGTAALFGPGSTRRTGIWSPAVACDLVRTELMRTVRRVETERVLRAREVLHAVTLVEVTTSQFEEAGRLEPADLRLLDAIHVAAALDLGDSLEGLVTYDDRLAGSAQANAITAIGPK